MFKNELCVLITYITAVDLKWTLYSFLIRFELQLYTRVCRLKLELKLCISKSNRTYMLSYNRLRPLA